MEPLGNKGSKNASRGGKAASPGFREAKIPKLTLLRDRPLREASDDSL